MSGESTFHYRNNANVGCTLAFKANDGLYVHVDGQLAYHYTDEFIRTALRNVRDGAECLVGRFGAFGAGAEGTTRDALLDFIEKWSAEHH